MVSNASWKRTMNEGSTVERYTGISSINYSILFRYYVTSNNYFFHFIINQLDHHPPVFLIFSPN